MSDLSTLRSIQRLSGAAFSVFVTLHLLTTASAALSNESYDHYLALFRKFYRPNPMVEGLVVVLPLIVHMISNSLIFMKKKDIKTEKPIQVPLSKKIHTYTGYLLSLLVPVHAFATRFGPKEASFEHIQEAIHHEMGINVAVPYFSVYLAIAVYHTIYGLNISFGSPLRRPLVYASMVGVLSVAYYGLASLAGIVVNKL
ncbi:hypothetical protein ABK040_014762 [Willaertia magna]